LGHLTPDDRARVRETSLFAILENRYCLRHRVAKMTPPPKKTLIAHINQAIQTRFNPQKVQLKKNARVPELHVLDADSPKPEKYPLVGDSYRLGRGSDVEIVVINQIVSSTHLFVTRDPKNSKQFVLQDNNSANGIYRGKKKIKALVLRHGDRFTLGPPELKASVSISFHNPAPWYLRAIRYALYGIGGVSALAATAIFLESTKINVSPLPDSNGPIVAYDDGLETPLRVPRTTAHVDLKTLQEFSPHLPKALIASEDARFYWHFGVDPYGVARAVVVARREGGFTQGASTLTQQVARSLFRGYVGSEDNFARKYREAVVSLKLESTYSKEQILLAYLNRVFLGADANGFEDAARHYFGKSAKDLDLSESATLVGILPGPNIFNPCANYNKAVERRNLVLGRMLETGAASEAEIREARRSRLVHREAACAPIKNTKAPFLYDYIFPELAQLLGNELAREGNFIIETGVDLKLQEKAELALRNNISTAGAASRYSQGSIVTLDYTTGIVRAMVGGVDYDKSQFNRATAARRQPGSTFKAFAYSAALEAGVPPGKSYSCDPIVYDGQTFRGCEHGAVGSADMFNGFALSENNIALRVARDVGLPKVIEVAQRLGINSPLKAVPGMILGQNEVTNLEITGAYGAIVDNGIWHRPRVIKRVYDSSRCEDRSRPRTCRVIYDFEADNQRSRRVLPANVSSTMRQLMRGVVSNGTGKNAALGVGEGGKTGTTNDNVDMWFIGFLPTRNLVTGVWLGRDDNKPTSGSSAQAAAVWGNYMRSLSTASTPARESTNPSNAGSNNQPSPSPSTRRQRDRGNANTNGGNPNPSGTGTKR
jgi:membrane peptidoglycan carboxypeptidase